MLLSNEAIRSDLALQDRIVPGNIDVRLPNLRFEEGASAGKGAKVYSQHARSLSATKVGRKGWHCYLDGEIMCL